MTALQQSACVTGFILSALSLPTIHTPEPPPCTACKENTPNSDSVELIQKRLQVTPAIMPQQSGMSHVDDKDLDFNTYGNYTQHFDLLMKAVSPQSLFVQFPSKLSGMSKLSSSELEIKSPGLRTGSMYTEEEMMKGCPVCNPQSQGQSQGQGTCARCLRLGYRHFDLDFYDSSRLFEVQNVLMRDGTAIFVGDHADKILDCGAACGPTWEFWSKEALQWAEYSGETYLNHTLEGAVCSGDNMVTQPALIVDVLFPTNVYHYYMETTFATFMTLAQIAEMQGCSEEHVKVYFNYFPHGGTSPFKPLWDVFVKNSGGMNEMNGCYKQLFFGHMARDYLRVDASSIYDARLSTWLTAYRHQARSVLVNQVNPPARDHRVFLLIHHARTPPWMRNISWYHPDIAIQLQPIDFAKLPILDQFAASAQADGFIGEAGGGLAQQIFLPVGASILQVSAVQPFNEADSEGRGWCGSLLHLDDPARFQQQDEGASRCYGNTAIHIGNTLLNWRYCKPNLMNTSAAFTDEDAGAVLKLLLSETDKARESQTARVCTVINDRSFANRSDEWPRCDSLIVAPIAKPNRTCGSSGVVGTSFTGEQNRTVTQYCLSPDYCY